MKLLEFLRAIQEVEFCEQFGLKKQKGFLKVLLKH